MSLLGIVLAGAACSFGEGVVLGYLKLFDSMLVNAWSSGTGMAGVGGSALYLGYIGAGLDLKWSFIATAPWMAVLDPPGPIVTSIAASRRACARASG